MIKERLAKAVCGAMAVILSGAIFNMAYGDKEHSSTFEIATERSTSIEIESMTAAEEPHKQVQILIPCIWGGFNITIEEYELICRTVYCEAGNQDIDTQIMAALTILNRTLSNKFPYSISEVIYQTEPYLMYEVTQWTGFEQYGWTEQVEQAVSYALERNDYPLDMFYFRTEHYHKFGVPYMQSGDLYFSTED